MYITPSLNGKIIIHTWKLSTSFSEWMVSRTCGQPCYTCTFVSITPSLNGKIIIHTWKLSTSFSKWIVSRTCGQPCYTCTFVYITPSLNGKIIIHTLLKNGGDIVIASARPPVCPICYLLLNHRMKSNQI